MSKYFISDPLFLSSKNGHKNHLRKFWSEKCPFFAFYGKVWLSGGYKIWARIFVWFLKIRAIFPRFFASKTWKFLWVISEFLWGILKLLWVIQKFPYWIFTESKSSQKFLKSALYFEENRVSKFFTFSSRFLTFSEKQPEKAAVHLGLLFADGNGAANQLAPSTRFPVIGQRLGRLPATGCNKKQ